MEENKLKNSFIGLSAREIITVLLITEIEIAIPFLYVGFSMTVTKIGMFFLTAGLCFGLMVLFNGVEYYYSMKIQKIILCQVLSGAMNAFLIAMLIQKILYGTNDIFHISMLVVYIVAFLIVSVSVGIYDFFLVFVFFLIGHLMKYDSFLKKGIPDTDAWKTNLTEQEVSLKEKCYLFEHTEYFKQIERIEDVKARYFALMEKYGFGNTGEEEAQIVKNIQKEYADICIAHNLI